MKHVMWRGVLVSSLFVFLLFLSFPSDSEAFELALSQAKDKYNVGDRVRIGLYVSDENMDQLGALYIRLTDLPDFFEDEGKYMTVNGTSENPVPIISQAFP